MFHFVNAPLVFSFIVSYNIAAMIKRRIVEFLEYLETKKRRASRTVRNYDLYLKRFRSFADAKKVIDVSENDDKLIVSEKAVWEDDQKAVLDSYKVGDIVEGEISALTSFGAFIKFGDNLEGLTHISELAWQRIDSPSEMYKVGDKIQAEIISIDGAKVFLSAKKLLRDPWMEASAKYQIGQVVPGTILKINPFGLFVELDQDIHGLAHISQLSNKPIANIEEIAKAGDEIEP